MKHFLNINNIMYKSQQVNEHFPELMTLALPVNYNANNCEHELVVIRNVCRFVSTSNRI